MDYPDGFQLPPPVYPDYTIDDFFGMGSGEFEIKEEDQYAGFDVGPEILKHYEVSAQDGLKELMADHAENIVRQRRKKNVSQIKHAIEEMKFKDHLVVDELEKALDPKLLDLIRELLVPEAVVDLDDSYNPKNQLRQAVLDQLMCMDSTPGKRAYSDDISYAAGKLYDNNDVIFEGENPVDILDYVMCMHPKSSYKIFKQIQETMSSYERRSAWNMDTYSAILKYHRAGRRLSKSMNKITKVSQLQYVDQDNPYNWFTLEYAPEYTYYAINMDPRVSFRYPTLKNITKVEEINEHDNYVILANLVIGDDVGGYGNNLRLLRELNDLRSGKTDVTVAVLIYTGQIASGNLDIIHVPRPHNMIAAAYLDDQTYDFEYVNKKAMIANQKRSERYFKTCMVKILRQQNSWLELINLIDQAKLNIDKIKMAYQKKEIKKVKKKMASRPTALERRQKEIYQLASNPDLDFGNEYYKIKPFKIQNSTPIYNHVMYIGNSIMAMNSVRKFVLEKGGKVEFLNGQWRMYK